MQDEQKRMDDLQAREEAQRQQVAASSASASDTPRSPRSPRMALRGRTVEDGDLGGGDDEASGDEDEEFSNPLAGTG